MIFKLFGGFLILTAGGLGAWNLVKLERRKLLVLDAWIDLIFYIRTQIDCYLMPIGEILQSAEPALLRSCMGDKAVTSLAALLKCAHLYLDPEAHRLLASFVREIGGSYREEQVKLCDYYIESLRRIREKQMEALPAKTRVSATLCICASFGIAILLW